MTANWSNGGFDTVSLSPATLAVALREHALPYVDEFLLKEDGTRAAPEQSLEETRALWIGEAIRQAILDDRIHTEIEPSSSTHDRLEGELVAGEVRRAASEQLFANAAQERLFAEAMAGNVLPKRRKMLALAAKVVFMVGDTAVLAGVFYRAGLDMPLAVASGVSMAATVVGTGAHFGRELALREHRRQRGAPPAHCPAGLIDLFTDGTDTSPLAWLPLASGVVAGLLLAMTLLGRGLGDPWSIAIAYGVFAALTFAGSASTEAYGTNAAAERVAECAERMAQHGAALEHFEQMEGRSAAAACQATMLTLASRYGAASAAITGTATADRRPDNPSIFGYETSASGRTAPELPAAPELQEHPSPQAPARDRKRDLAGLRLRPAFEPDPTVRDGEHQEEHVGNGKVAAR